MDAIVHNVITTDLPHTLRLNDRAVPHVNRISADLFSWFHDSAPYFKVLERQGQVEAFLIALDQSSDYDSPNFRFFGSVRSLRLRGPDRGGQRRSATRSRFSSVSRSRAIYPRSGATYSVRRKHEARERRFTTLPPRHGFRQVGTQDTEGGAKSVALLVKELI